MVDMRLFGLFVIVLIIVLPLVLAAGALLLNRAALFAPPGPLARLATYLGSNVAELQPQAALPELRPGVYPVKPELLCREVAAALDTLGWDWRQTHDCRYQATVTTPLLKFTDDVTVTVEPVGEASARLYVRSAARIGRGDFGANRRHVLDLVAAVEHQLSQGKPVKLED